jgi:DNA-directed RNA polymerase sigma subunit (sigma70/sigma32)
VRVAREFRDLKLIPAQVDQLTRDVLQANNKVKRHERTIRDLHRKMKDFRDSALQREVRRKIEGLRGDIRSLERRWGDPQGPQRGRARVQKGLRAAKARRASWSRRTRLVVRSRRYTNRGLQFSTCQKRNIRPDEAVDKFEYRRGYKFHLRHVVDPPDHHPRDRRPGTDVRIPVHMIETINEAVPPSQPRPGGRRPL